MSDLHARHIRKGEAIYATSDGAWFPHFLTCRSLQCILKCLYIYRSKNAFSKLELRPINNYPVYLRKYTNDSIIIKLTGRKMTALSGRQKSRKMQYVIFCFFLSALNREFLKKDIQNQKKWRFIKRFCFQLNNFFWESKVCWYCHK